MLTGCGGSDSESSDAQAPSSDTAKAAPQPAWTPPATKPQKIGMLSTSTPQGGTLVITPAKFDFGDVGPGTMHPATFQLTNNGRSPLRIDSATPSCTCTTITDLAGTELAPGSTVQLEAALESPKQPGEKSAKVFVRLSGVEQPLIVEIVGNVTLPIRAEPAFADALKGKTSGTIMLSSIDGKPFKVLSSNGGQPTFIGYNAAKDPPQSRYAVAWSIMGMACEAMPRWWVFETDRADSPLVPCRVRNDCTGSKRDMGRYQRHWIFSDQLLDAGTVRAGVPFTVKVDLEYYNPRQAGAVTQPAWSNRLSASVATSAASVSLSRATPIDGKNVQIELQVVPSKGFSGLLYLPVQVSSATGSGPVDVIAKVVP
ncbi:MAG: DUF1573 domain-containing protein [Phycisphaerales bacterium]|nr:DUF1573 domain-containing protein [Phycisphaerales bacterium]